MNANQTIVVVGKDISADCINTLSRLGFAVRLLPECTSLGKGVDTHADLMMFPLDGTVFIYEAIARSLPGLCSDIKEKGYTICLIPGAPSSEYPLDIGTNCLSVGKYIFSKNRYTATQIKEFAASHGYTAVNVNQGYSRCAACPLGDHSVITSDPSIKKASMAVGIDVLTISEGNISLRGFDHGFIGGTCGVFEDRIFFAGDITTHPDAEDIVAFCAARGITAVSLSDEPLRDIGSIFFF